MNENTYADTVADSSKAKATDAKQLQIPDDVREKHPDLIDLIVRSESMNNEERQYWVNILPVMTPDQIKNLQDILVNEKKQLAAIDKKYSKEIESIGSEQLLQKMDQERDARRSKRKEVESEAEIQENKHAEDILEQIQNA